MSGPKLPVEEARAKILAFEDAMRALPFKTEPDSSALEQIDFNTMHQWTPGIYIRTMMIPKNTVNTSKIHRIAHVAVLRMGKLSIVDSFGESHVITAGRLIITNPGTKRAVVALQDSVLTTFQPNPDDCRDLEELERRFIAATFEDFDKEQQS